MFLRWIMARCGARQFFVLMLACVIGAGGAFCAVAALTHWREVACRQHSLTDGSVTRHGLSADALHFITMLDMSCSLASARAQ